MSETTTVTRMDTTWCGACQARDLPDERCPYCGALLRGESADALRWAVAERHRLREWMGEAQARASALDHRIAGLVGDLRATHPIAPAPIPVAAPFTAPTAGRTAETALLAARTMSPRAVLTWTGGILLGLASIAFAVWAWTEVGPLGRFAILLAATAVAAGTAHLVRRVTPVTAESLDVVAVVLLLVDWSVAWSVVPRSVTGPLTGLEWVLLGAVVVGAVALSLARLNGSTVLPHVGVVLAGGGLVALPLVQILTSAPESGPIALAALAATTWLSLLPLALGLLTARRWPTTRATGDALGAIAWLVVLVSTMDVTASLLAAGADGAALTVAAAGVPLSAVVAWRTLPAARRRRGWTSLHGIAAAAGGVVVLLPTLVQVYDVVAASVGAGTWAAGTVVPWVSLGAGSLLLVGAAVGLARWVGSAPARTGALSVLLGVPAVVVAAGQLGIWAPTIDALPTAADLARAAIGLAVLAVPVLVAVVALPRSLRSRVAGLDWFLATSCVGSAVLMAVWALIAVPAVSGLAAGPALVTATAAVLTAAVTAILAHRTRGTTDPLLGAGLATALGTVVLCAWSAVLAATGALGPLASAGLLLLAAVVLVVWRSANGTWLLPAAARAWPVAGATLLTLGAVLVLLGDALEVAPALALTGVVALIVTAGAGRWPHEATVGVVAGAWTGTLVAAGLPALAGLPLLLVVPALREGLDLGLGGATVTALAGAWLVLAGLAALPLTAGRVIPFPSRASAVPASSGLVVLGGLVLATAAPVPAWVPAAALLVVAVVGWTLLGSVPDDVARVAGSVAAAVTATVLALGWVEPLTWGPTVLAVAVAAAAGRSAVRARSSVAAVLATVAAALSAVAVAPLAMSAGASVAAGSPWYAYAIGTAGACLVVAAPALRPGLNDTAGGHRRDAVGVAAAGVGTGSLGVAALVAPGATALGVVLAMAAAGLLALSRWTLVRAARYGGLAAAVGASWAFAVASGVEVLEAWTVPAAAGLLVAGLWAVREAHTPHLRHPSWLTVGPALLVLVLPSAVALLAGDAPTWRLAATAAVGAAALALGLGRHEQAPVVVGALGLLAVAVQVLTPVVAASPLWVVLAVGGVALTWVGFTWERRRAQAHHAAETWARFV